MLKIFPLGDEVLSLLPAADPSKKKQFTASQITALASNILSPSSEMRDKHLQRVEQVQITQRNM